MLESEELIHKPHNAAHSYLRHHRFFRDRDRHPVRQGLAQRYLEDIKTLLNLDPKGPPFYRPPGQGG